MASLNNTIEPKINKKVENESSYNLGRQLANPPPGDEVVISGITGSFPKSENVNEFRDNLFNKVDMVTPTERWPPGNKMIPKRTGQIKNIGKFDNAYFGINNNTAINMDPMIKIFLEKAVEAILDAGMNPKDLEGTNTGVFVGTCHSESEAIFVTTIDSERSEEKLDVSRFARSMIPHRVSYHLKLKGPSFTTDSACSSSLYAFEEAYRAIRTGLCDAAIVGGANLCLHPNVSSQFNSLGVLSDDGACRAFDQGGKGYARSEAICAVFLQKSKNAKRIYSQVIHVKTNSDGYKETGITFPSGQMQSLLLKECYEECQVDPSKICFMEAHGTGTLVGDPEEAFAINKVFCQNRKSPLLIGSLKSNIGHTEPSSGLCSLIKCIIALESGYIPPNIHYSSPRANIESLVNGRLKVVSEKTPLPDSNILIGINCFGFGGSNCHAIITNNKKEKIKDSQSNNDLPRLVCISGRVEKSVELLLDDVIKHNVDIEHIRLLQSAFSKDIPGHLYRGYSIVTKSGEMKRSIKPFSGEKPPLYLIFSGYENCFQVVGKNLLSLPTFASSIEKIQNILSIKDINIIDILTKNSSKTVSDKIFGSIAVQIGIADIFKCIKLKPDFVLGYSLGELVNAYFNEALTLEETLLSTYTITTALEKLNGTLGTSYFVKLNHKELNYILNLSKTHSESVEVMVVDSENSIITTDNAKSVLNFLGKLKENKIQVTELGSQIIFSKKLSKIKNELEQQLLKIILEPKKWGNSGQYATAEYLVDVLLNNTLFKNLSWVKKRSLLLEIGSEPSAITETIKNKTRNSGISLLENKEINVGSVLKALGNLYESGFNLQIDLLYPEVQFPVSRGTPMISSSIKWYHEKEWLIQTTTENKRTEAGEVTFRVNIKNKNFSFISGHVIDGRNLFPATGYLRFVWEAFCAINYMNITAQENMKMVFQNCKFLRATYVPAEGDLFFSVVIQRNSGNFEVIESGSVAVTGRIYVVSDTKEEVVDLPIPETKNASTTLLQSKDIYKEFRLRGYNYSGMFRGIKECSIDASKGQIKWENNWISFLDNMLQMQILNVDTRLLYVPISIDKLTINSESHMKYVNNSSLTIPVVPVYVYRDCGIIKTEAVEIRGLAASAISKRKLRSEPVLEKYEFIPNITKLGSIESIRVNMQIALENSYSIQVKVVEIIDEATLENSELLGPIIFNVLSDQPLIKAEILILSKNEITVSNATVENKDITTQVDCKIIVGTNLLSRKDILQKAFEAFKEKGHIISRESLNFNISDIDLNGITILTIHTTETETLVLLCKDTELQTPTLVNISSKTGNFDWLPTLQNACKSANKEVIVYSQNEPLNGILGLVNCIRREQYGQNIKCVFIMDEAPPFDPQNEFYINQLKKNLSFNVYKNGVWGTYRHLILDDVSKVETEHCFVNTLTKGDLSSLKWIPGNLNHKTKLKEGNTLVHVYYSAINFRDVMTAVGKIQADAVTTERLKQDCIQGFEFSGRDSNGRRVIGITTHGALSTSVVADNYLLWEVPDQYTLEEAATLPVVYCTCLIGLIDLGKMKKGDSVLIHSGTGGIGQAAINLALHYGCTVYTTVGTSEKREFLKKWFPQLTDENIGCSRDLSFVNFVMSRTNGRGVDIVLNSLAEEKLLASVQCLAQGGRFIEIGKFDLVQNTSLNLNLLKKNASFHSVMLDRSFYCNNIPLRKYISQIFRRAFVDGIAKPLKTTIYQKNQVEEAFRFMASGKHMGKVLIQIRDEEKEKVTLPKIQSFEGYPRYVCDDDKTYIITGGLGGFGLELADWLILRGARKLVLTSRTGIQTGYQTSRVRIWKSYDINVKISTADVTQKSGCKQLILEAKKLGPIGSIFNLAVVLKDAILENQNQESFKISFGPKACATKHLDELTRELCPLLRDFVVFSSVSCGRGNAGQTNYGMANSVMERICEQRKADGFPALAIEWGAVGDVGLVAELQEEHLELEISGTLQQRISNCLDVLDKFLVQNHSTIVSSMVVAEKKSFSGNANNIVAVIANILGIKDMKSIGLHTPFPELGLDSIMAVEIKQTVEREFQIFFTPQDIRNMTFARLQEIQNEREENDGTSLETQEKIPNQMEIGFKLMGNEATNNIPVLKLKSKVEDLSQKLLFFPGIEGAATALQSLINNLEMTTFGIQIGFVYEKDTIIELANAIVPYIVEMLPPKSVSFNMCAYSYGAVLALEVISILESKGYRGTLICVDGAPQVVMELTKIFNLQSDQDLQTELICKMLEYKISFDQIIKYKEELYKCKSLDDRIDIAYQINVKNGNLFTASHMKQMIIGIYKRIKSVCNYTASYSKIHSKVFLLRAKECAIQGLAEDYELSKICGQQVEVKVVDANHVSILDSIEVADFIHSTFKSKK